MPRFNNILETIGNTPLIRINKLAPAGVNVYAKVEAFNPMGSIKDRMALAVIEKAEQTGQLKPGQTVVEATSGNTGIGLAMVCAQKGYPLVVTMAESFSVERRKLLRFLGAKVVLTPASEKGTGMLNKAIELAETHGYYLCRQFENDANAEVHTRTTAQEVLADFADDPLHYWVSGFGTGGTLLGVARALKKASPGTRIVATEPDNAQLLGSGIAQPKGVDGKPSASHPRFRPHLMQGWSPDFLSRLMEQAVNEGMIDEIVPVSGDDALNIARQLARQEGIFAGISSGATLATALNIARKAPAGTNIVCMLPDTGERYLSTPLFSDIEETMNEEELALSASTPGYRFDAPAPQCAMPQKHVATPTSTPATASINTDAYAEQFVNEVLAGEPIVMFALEWCEFSWSVRRYFRALGIFYRSIDLDSVEYQVNDFGGKIRAVLGKRLGIPTIPQIFIAGKHIGGCTDLFDNASAGAMQTQLDEHGIDYDRNVKVDPYSMLPKWLHPRKSA